MARQARGNLDPLTGYFHVENSLRKEVARFSKTSAQTFRSIMFEEAEAAGLTIAFWHFHPCGFGLLLEKTASTTQASARLNEPSRFIQILKQRITSHHNRQCQHLGGIWKDRTKIFHLPDTLHDRIEVAAYIAARPEKESGDDAMDWPSTLQEARSGSPFARDALKHLVGKQRFSQSQMDLLLEKRKQILRKIAEPSKTPGRRGRTREWRPACEQGANANAQVRPPNPRDYRAIRRRAKKEFFAMLARYEAFCEKTGYDRIPWGYPGEDRLPAWASKQRGEFNAGRMPQWQVEALADTTVLEPLNSSNSPNPSRPPKPPGPPSDAWFQQYKALQVFYQQHGHARVKRTDSENQTLANWVWTQRAELRKGKLHPEKRKLLDELNFLWEIPPKDR